MSLVSDLELEDLPGVEPHLICKLKRAGIQSVLDLAVSIPYELATTILSNLVMKAQKVLTNSGILTKEFCTAEEVLERRKSLVRFTTGSANLDALSNTKPSQL